MFTLQAKAENKVFNFIQNKANEEFANGEGFAEAETELSGPDITEFTLEEIQDNWKAPFSAVITCCGDSSLGNYTTSGETFIKTIEGEVYCGDREDHTRWEINITEESYWDRIDGLDQDTMLAECEEKQEREASEIIAKLVNYPKTDENEIWYRGHANLKWDLCPSALRENERKLVSLAEKQHLFIEKANDFNLNIGIKNTLSQLSFMQHYGIRTNLLDWSTNPLIALFFAVNDIQNQNVDGKLFILKAGLIDKIQAENMNFLDCLENQTGSKFYTVEKEYFSDRMISQQSRFTYHTTEKINYDKCVKEIIIPRYTKEILRIRLNALGIHYGNVFQSLDKLAEEINRS